MNLESELQTFESYQDLCTEQGSMEIAGPQILRWKPAQPSKVQRPRLGILGLVHGNEVLGLAVINRLLQQIQSGVLNPQIEIYFGLGNLPAAFAHQRFLDLDLNRCFGLSSQDNPESRRAREMEKFMLDHCDYLIDLHQTVQPSRSPFLIFQYTSERCLAFVRAINLTLPVILQFDLIGDQTGMTTDEYVRSRGGLGLTLELGQIGFSLEHLELGQDLCVKAIQALQHPEAFLSGAATCLESVPYPLYRLEGRLRIEESGSRLHLGWKNMDFVDLGEVIGTAPSGPLLSPFSGHLLFPKYSGSFDIGQSLFHICESVHPSDLPAASPLGSEFSAKVFQERVPSRPEDADPSISL